MATSRSGGSIRCSPPSAPNVSRDAWEQGKFEWMVEPDELLKGVIEEMATIVKQEHTDNKEKPAEVGRKEAAYRGCYVPVR